MTAAVVSHVTWSLVAVDDVINETTHVHGECESDVVHNVTAAAATTAGQCDANTYEYVDLTQVGVVRATFVMVYAAVAVVALVGNTMVVRTIVSQQHMRSAATNCYILNLAVADLLVAGVVMPLKLAEYTAPCDSLTTLLSLPAVCPLVYYVLPVIVFASVLTLVAISVER